MKLRFLLATSTPWLAELGAARVLVELAEELRGLGHQVEKFSADDAFPSTGAKAGGVRRLLQSLALTPSFPAHLARFVRSRPGQFDVIDANQGCLDRTKSGIHHSGLLVSRSTGLAAIYDAFEREARRRWPVSRPVSARARALLGAPAAIRHRRATEAALSHADLINVPSREEMDYLRRDRRFATKVRYLPIGLSDARRASFRHHRLTPAERLTRQLVVFVGTWRARKGSHDWPAIVRQARRAQPGLRFRFLGTHCDASDVLAPLDPKDRPSVEVVPVFPGASLPSLLADATVGAFPSYLEAFGIGVLEQLAAGLPVVAYDAPGPRETAGQQRWTARIDPGDCPAFAAELVRISCLPPDRYAEAGADSDRVADGFRWREIAETTCALYSEHLAGLRRDRGPERR